MVDLVEMKAILWHDETMGAKYSTWKRFPPPCCDKAKELRQHLIEAVADSDDALMEKYLEGEDPTVDELKSAIRKATIGMKIFPVLMGSSFKNKGVQTLLDAVVDYLPSPLDIPADDRPRPGRSGESKSSANRMTASRSPRSASRS